MRFSVKFISGQKPLPLKEEMLLDFERDLYERQMQRMEKRKMHQLGHGRVRPYFASLSSIAEIEPVKPVYLDLYERSGYVRNNDRKNFRRYKYQVLDDYSFRESL